MGLCMNCGSDNFEMDTEGLYYCCSDCGHYEGVQ